MAAESSSIALQAAIHIQASDVVAFISHENIMEGLAGQAKGLRGPSGSGQGNKLLRKFCFVVFVCCVAVFFFVLCCVYADSYTLSHLRKSFVLVMVIVRITQMRSSNC